MVFGSNILSHYSEILDIRSALIVGADDEMRLFIATVLASVWSEAEVDELDLETTLHESPKDWKQFDLLIVDSQSVPEGKMDSGADWFSQHHRDTNLPKTLFLVDKDNAALIKKVLELGANACIYKDDDLSQHLLQRICGLEDDTTPPLKPSPPDDFFTQTAALFERESSQENDSSSLGESIAMLVIKLDSLSHPPGNIDSETLLARFLPQVKAWIAEDDASTPHSMATSTAIYVLVSEILGDVHSELIAENICQRARDGKLNIDGQAIPATLSLGLCRVDDDPDIDIAGFTAQAEQACAEASDNGGDQFKASTYSDAVKDEAKPLFDALALAKAKRLNIDFEAIINTGEDQQPSTFQPKISIYDEQGDPCSWSRLSLFLSTPGNASQLDRITLIQSIKFLHRKDPARHSRILMDLSTQSASNPAFWDWLEQQLNKSGRGQQFIFVLKAENFQTQRIDAGTMHRLSQSSHCQFAILNQEEGELTLKLAIDLALSWIVIDMGDDSSTLNCEQISKTTTTARELKLKVILRNVDSSEKLFCAYTLGAEQLQGELASQWESIQLTPLD